MKFAKNRPFTPLKSSISEVIYYLRNEISALVRDLNVGLTKLNFTDNFDSFKWSGTIGASETSYIKNLLTTSPEGRIIVRSNSHEIVDGDRWDASTVSLKNDGTTSASVTVIFYR